MSPHRRNYFPALRAWGAFLLMYAGMAFTVFSATETASIPAPALPSIPARAFDITRYGAIGDGSTMNTASIQKAITAAEGAGGGIVTIPAGRFISGPITLGNNIDLHLENGATLAMSKKPGNFSGVGNENASFITASGAHDIRISGDGVIDGQGEDWWKAFRAAKTNGTAVGMPRRPQMIYMSGCNRVEIVGISTLNPPNTHCSIRQSTDLTIHNFTATAPGNSPNTDALNLGENRNILIEKCKIATGDDNIVLLGSRAGSQPGVENVVIRDCQLGVGHGLSIGSYTTAGVRNVSVSNIQFDGTTSGIRMKAWRDRGGIVEKISYQDITMKNVAYPIYISSYYPREPDGPAQDIPPAGHNCNPVWRDIEIKNVTATGARVAAILWGLPDEPISDVSFDHVNISAKSGALLFHAKGITFAETQFNAPGPKVQLYDATAQGIETTQFAGGAANIR